jgi:pimeloyl-ACP methyl ester carboxylesterase
MLWIDRDLNHDNFCQDPDIATGRMLAAVQKPISVASFEGKITEAAWKKLPCWYQVSGNDRMIPPEAEQFMANRINAKTISLPLSHASTVSHPQAIADFILDAADSLAVSVAHALEMQS